MLRKKNSLCFLDLPLFVLTLLRMSNSHNLLQAFSNFSYSLKNGEKYQLN